MKIREIRLTHLWVLIFPNGDVVQPGDGAAETSLTVYPSREMAERDLEHFRRLYGWEDVRVERLGWLGRMFAQFEVDHLLRGRVAEEEPR